MVEEYHELCPHGALYELFSCGAALSYANTRMVCPNGI